MKTVVYVFMKDGTRETVELSGVNHAGGRRGLVNVALREAFSRRGLRVPGAREDSPGIHTCLVTTSERP